MKQNNALKKGCFNPLKKFITIILLFVLTATSGNVTILNYENKLLDKYSSWQMQLEQKEKELKEREKALIEKEKY